MTKKMLQFTTRSRQMPDKRDPAERRLDWQEIYTPFSKNRGEEQASRCSQCGVPYCQIHCPVHNHIPDWLKMAAGDRMEEAYELVASTNVLPEVCGRICPQDRLCEGNCVIEKAGHGTVTIGTVEQHITETAWDQGLIKPIVPPREQKKSVGIIGAGPAGLAAAARLREQGYQVHIYDRYDRPGGLMVYGIPNFKLDKSVVKRRTDWLADSKVVFHQNVNVGQNQDFDELRARHDAVLLACGTYQARKLQVPGVSLPGVVLAMDYLTASNKKGLGDAVPAFDNGTLNADGRRIAVIGGGDTAMDCVRTALRQGAKSVTCHYRRDRENMPGSQREVNNAMEEGVIFDWLTGPKAILGDDKVRGLYTQTFRLDPPDASGRQNPQPVEGKTENKPADMVILALGYDPEDLAKAGMQGMKTRKPDEPHSPVSVSWSTMMTSLPGVFAAGDIARGASLVVWAVADGQSVARSIGHYLRGELTWPSAGSRDQIAS